MSTFVPLRAVELYAKRSPAFDQIMLEWRERPSLNSSERPVAPSNLYIW